MTRYVNEAEIRRLLPMAQAIALVERAFRDRAEGQATDIARERTRQPGGTLHILQGAAPRLGIIGFKAYFTGQETSTFLVHLIDFKSGRLEGLVEAEWMGRMRTGAATGVATRTLAREDASVVACIGAGRHARTQLEAVCAVRPIREARALGRDPARVAEFCRAMSQSLGIAVRPAPSAEAALAGADIVNVMTRADAPLFPGTLVAPGQHINAAGSNALNRREIDVETVRRASVIAVDSRTVARRECGDLLPAVEQGLVDWNTVAELGEIMIGRRPGRTDESEVTLFESHGMGLQDLYCGKYVLDTARAEGVGIDLPIGD
jgi:ornithine cyclodeaminase